MFAQGCADSFAAVGSVCLQNGLIDPPWPRISAPAGIGAASGALGLGRSIGEIQSRVLLDQFWVIVFYLHGLTPHRKSGVMSGA
jgi:hypothetical protein